MKQQKAQESARDDWIRLVGREKADWHFRPEHQKSKRPCFLCDLMQGVIVATRLETAWAERRGE